MPTIRNELAIAAGATVVNILAGSKFEFMPRAGVVSFYAVSDGAAVPGNVRSDVTFGNSIDMDDLAVPTFTATLGPDRDKHLLGKGFARGGDRLQIKVTNRDANPVNFRWLLELQYT